MTRLRAQLRRTRGATLVLVAMLAGLFACCREGSLPPGWTQEERENAKHLTRSMDASRTATKLFNAQSDQTSVADSTVQEIQRLRRLALHEAALVRDDVLEKAMPGLTRVWRQRYQRSLELAVGATDRGDATGQIAAKALWAEWVDWINENKSKIRVPK